MKLLPSSNFVGGWSLTFRVNNISSKCWFYIKSASPETILCVIRLFKPLSLLKMLLSVFLLTMCRDFCPYYSCKKASMQNAHKNGYWAGLVYWNKLQCCLWTTTESFSTRTNFEISLFIWQEVMCIDKNSSAHGWCGLSRSFRSFVKMLMKIQKEVT